MLLYGYYSCRNTESSSPKAHWVWGLRGALCSLCPLLHSVEHCRPLTCFLAEKGLSRVHSCMAKETEGKLSFVLEMPPLVWGCFAVSLHSSSQQWHC